MENKKLTEQNIIDAAKLLDVEPAAVKAVLTVESRGTGFLSIGEPVILFEGHIFWNQLKKKNISPEKYLKGNEDILYPEWTTKFYLNGIKEYSRLYRAKLINEEAALSSTSWGLFQLMGFNYKACGFDSVKNFVNAMYASEYEQLKAFINFIKTEKLDDELRNKDWTGFAKRYNGPLYAKNKYDIKLRDAYNKFSGK